MGSTDPRVRLTMLEPYQDEKGIVGQSVLRCYEYRHSAGQFLHFPTASGRAFIGGSEKVPVWLLHAHVGGNTAFSDSTQPVRRRGNNRYFSVR